MRRVLLLTVIVGIAAAGSLRAQDWEAQSSGTTALLNGVGFVDPMRGVAVGDGGTVLETENGGQTWSPLALTIEDMQDVAFGDSTGLIVGDSGKIFRTINAGQDWTEVASGTEANLLGVAIGERGLAYAAGREGSILRSTDSGASWTVVETGVDRYRAVAAHRLSAWAVGNDGAMRATVDGGQNWFSPVGPTLSDLHDVVFINDLQGWVVGQNNTVLATDDGGLTWTSRNASIGIGLNTVFFGNSELGWTAGRLGNTFRSTDGALAWNAEATPTLEELNALDFAGAFHGWAVGEQGTILTRQVPTTELSVDLGTIEWDSPAVPAVHDVVRGDLGELIASAGNFQVATDECLAAAVSGTSVAFAQNPEPGEGYWFLVRVDVDGTSGTYDSGGFGQVGFRDAEITSSTVDCR